MFTTEEILRMRTLLKASDAGHRTAAVLFSRSGNGAMAAVDAVLYEVSGAASRGESSLRLDDVWAKHGTTVRDFSKIEAILSSLGYRLETEVNGRRVFW